MKKCIAGVIAITITFSTFAAEMMSRRDFNKIEHDYINMGTISTSGKSSASDAKADLSRKADVKGGDVFVLTSGNTNNLLHGTADVYKKKQ